MQILRRQHRSARRSRVGSVVLAALLGVAGAACTEGDSGSSGLAPPSPASEPGVLDNTAALDSVDDLRPHLATDGAGNWLAVWAFNDISRTRPSNDWDIALARSDDDGATWTDPVALNTNAASDSGRDWRPKIATDGKKPTANWVVVWYSDDPLPTLAEPDGTVGPDADIFVSRSSDVGVTWTPPAALNSDAPGSGNFDFDPRIVTDGTGNWLAVWYTYEQSGGIGRDADIAMARSTDLGATWTAVAPLNTNATSDRGNNEFVDADLEPEVATDGSSWVAVWYSTTNLGGIGTDADILVSRSIDDGATWTAPAALNGNAAADTGEDRNPRIATDGDGNWVAVWESTEDLGGALGADADILFSRYTDTSATWTAPAALHASAASDSGEDLYPDILSDGANTWVAVWHSTDDQGGAIGTDYDILVSRSIDDGVSWSAPAPLNVNATTDPLDDLHSRIATDGAGIWLAVWHSNETLGGKIAPDYDILFERSPDDGATWSAPPAP